MNPDDFEKRLEHQRLRPIPGAWRGEILDAARRARDHQLSTITSQPSCGWREFLWPCPQAWAGLAAVWVLIVVLNSVTHEPASAAKGPNAPRAPEVLMALRDHRRLLAELIESPMEVEPPKPSVPGPRSQLPQRIVAG